jgi:hypothetical protein
MDEHSPSSLLAIRLGLWSASGATLAMIVFTVCFSIVLTTQPIFLWTNMAAYQDYLTAHRSIWPDLARLSMLLFGPLLVITLNSIHEYARPADKILTRIGLCFGLGFAVLTGIHYFVQLSTVRIAAAQDHLAGMDQVIQANPYSAVAALNMLGWTIVLGLASLFVAPVFRGGRLERVIRGALIVNGVCCLLGGLGYVLDQTLLIFLTINLGMGGAVTAASVGLVLLFRRLRHAAGRSALGEPD